MKKQSILLFVLVSLFTVTARAQFSIGINGGYHSLKYSVENGSNAIRPGMGFDLGYTVPFKNRHWALFVGMGANYYNTAASLNSGSTVIANQVDDMGAGFEYRVTAKRYQETQHMIGIGVPLYLQLSPGKHQRMNWYFKIGPKFILPMEVNVRASAEQMNMQGYYPDVNLLINTELPLHGFGTAYNWSGRAVKLLNPGLAISGGTGLRFPLKNGSHLVTGILVDYGVTDMKKENGQPLASYNAPLATGANGNSLLATSNTRRIIPFSAVVQVSYEFGPRKKKSRQANNPLIDLDALGKIINPPQTDGDKDGVPDKSDDCPCIAGPACYKGCPDTDGDGVLDKDDNCPDIKGLKTNSGCPILDTDKDGINDDADKCPDVAGVIKYNGCPVPDTDGDGVNDEDDNCPKTAGPKDNRGCPVIKSEVIQRLNFAAENILFETNTATLITSSFKGLNDVVQIMQENPGIQLYIDGHTDNVGSDEFNMDLSNRRAAAVQQYILTKGADAASLHAAGHGESMPVASNNTVQGRQQNRRVELKLKYN